MASRKPKDFQIEIPEPMIYEVDKLVGKSGLYSDEIDFVLDAVRRLIIESKNLEVIPKSVDCKLHSRCESNEKEMTQKKTLNNSLKGDL